ncbi:uncharacterized protein LOC141845808 isoform X2 [Curcuma longa]
MVFVDYAGSVLPYVGHAPWDGVHLADFVMPFFLFIAGVSVSIVYKDKSNKLRSTRKAVVRAVKLFILGVLLQGGYFHGINSLTFGVDIDRIRVFGILQRIAIGYIVAALCEIWLSTAATPNSECGLFKDYYFQWIIMFVLSSIYVGLLHGIYVPDWKYEPQEFALSSSSMQIRDVIETVKCGVRGDLGPACNAAGMIDRKLLGIKHLYKKPVFRNLKECRTPGDENGAYATPSWCKAPFDPEGILSSLTAVVSCIFGLHFGHTLVLLEDHKSRLTRWLLFSLATSGLGLILACIGVPLNKSLYTISYMFLTTGVAVAMFCALYVLVDIYEYKSSTYVFQWMGRHSLSIFVLVASNIAVIAIQGFYWRNTKNNIVHWIVSLVRKVCCH